MKNTVDGPLEIVATKLANDSKRNRIFLGD